MDKVLKNITWLNSWETNKLYNIEIGLNNRHLIKGYIPKNNFGSLEELPDVKFFLKLEKVKPKLYENDKFERGEYICNVNGEKIRIIYYYNDETYMLLDSNDKILRKDN